MVTVGLNIAKILPNDNSYCSHFYCERGSRLFTDILGAHKYHKKWKCHRISRSAQKISPMLVSVVVRFLTDSIYSFSSSRNDTTLIRWSIRHDDRVEAGSSNVNVWCNRSVETSSLRVHRFVSFDPPLSRSVSSYGCLFIRTHHWGGTGSQAYCLSPHLAELLCHEGFNVNHKCVLTLSLDSAGRKTQTTL